MPRKVNYGVDFDDDGYGDYDYEYDDHVDDNEDEADSNGATNSADLWRCSIRTYDNEDSMTVCDICGVLRQPLDHSKIERNAALNRDFGVSVLARCLFSSSLFQVPQNAENDPLQVDGLMWEVGNNVCKDGNFKGNFHQCRKAFCSFCQSRIEIAPFRFDAPSPDDLVLHGRQSSQNGQKANFQNVRPPRVSSRVSNMDDASDAHTYTKKFKNSSLPLVKGKQDALTSSEKSNQSNFGASVIQSSYEAPDNSSVLVQGKDRSLEGSSSSAVEAGKQHDLSNSMNNMSLSDKPGNSGGRRVKSLAEYQPDKWMLPDRAEDTWTQLNLAIVGHVDSGKSTLSGRLLYLLGRITQKEMHKNEKEAKIQGKGSFSYAWALDESPEERERGITMTVAVAYFDTKRYHVVVLDSPGHKDFVPNMISGTQADAAILVIDAITGAFEAGMDSTKGQTREHAQLIRSFGVEQIIVAINKMDGVDYSKERFDSIKTQLGIFLRSCGFRDSSISWIPLSVVENQNLVAAASDPWLSSWFQGPSLLDAIDSIQPPSRNFSKPLLMPICDVVRSSLGQVPASGKLEAGALRIGMKVLLMPSDLGTVRSLERDSKPCTVARAGDSVAVSLSGIDVNNVLAEGVLCHPDFPVAVVKRLELKVLVLELKIPILAGSQLEFHIHHTKEAATVAKIVSLLDPKTGKVTKKRPRYITSKQSAVIEVFLQGEVCADEFSNSRALGRAFLRALGRTIAVGVVTKVIDDQQ